MFHISDADMAPDSQFRKTVSSLVNELQLVNGVQISASDVHALPMNDTNNDWDPLYPFTLVRFSFN
jgi:hypothetical protein